MIPSFPEFKSLELSDKKDVEVHTTKFVPYSDFNFISMWSWDIKKEMSISVLHDNFVVRFTDYITGDAFYSFLGENNIEETILSLLELSGSNQCPMELKLLPEHVQEKINTDVFLVTEDEDNFDYVFSLEKLATYNGNRMRSKRNLVNRFLRQYSPEVKILDPYDKKTMEDILSLYDKWVKNKNGKDAVDTQNEILAFNKLLAVHEEGHALYVGVYVDNCLIGFIVNEVLQDGHVMLHFEKADENFEGVYAYLMQENAKILLAQGKQYINYEQDLGLPGLRLGKKSFRPDMYFKKFKVSRIVDSH